MAILIRMCFFLMLFGIYDTTEWKPEIYDKGENVTILQTDGKQNLEITFYGSTSKQHVTNVMTYDSRKNLTEGISINRNYTGRITRMEMNNGILSVLLLNVNFMDSGNYAVSTLEGSVEKRKKSILVPRTVIRVQDSGLFVVQFMCNKTNISSIIIEMIKPTHHRIAIYDVEQANCSRHLYMRHTENCVLNGNRFYLTLQKVSWLDKGTYVAWDDKSFLLDSIDLDIQDGTITSSLETTKEYVTVPSTANAKQNDSNVSNPQSTYSPDTSVPGDENVLSIWLLVSSVVVVLVVTYLAIVAVRKLYQRKGTKSKEEDITCSDPAIRMGAASNTALQSDDDDEREYEEPRSIEMELNACLETISNPVNIYEKLHPYGNQGNHIYRSLPPENII